MIILTKLNDRRFGLNYKMIEAVQENPDTTIKLINGNTYLVKESLEEIMKMIFENEKALRKA